MTISGFLTIPGIEGASTNAQHVDEIDVYSVSWHIGQEAGKATGRPGSSVASWSSFEFGKSYDKSSPDLAQAVATGKQFAEINFVVSATVGGGLTDYLSIKLLQAQLDRYEILTGENQLEEVVSIRCSKLVVDFEEHDSAGTSVGHHEVSLSGPRGI